MNTRLSICGQPLPPVIIRDHLVKPTPEFHSTISRFAILRLCTVLLPFNCLNLLLAKTAVSPGPVLTCILVGSQLTVVKLACAVGAPFATELANPLVGHFITYTNYLRATFPSTRHLQAQDLRPKRRVRLPSLGKPVVRPRALEAAAAVWTGYRRILPYGMRTTALYPHPALDATRAVGCPAARRSNHIVPAAPVLQSAGRPKSITCPSELEAYSAKHCVRNLFANPPASIILTLPALLLPLSAAAACLCWHLIQALGSCCCGVAPRRNSTR